jgi:hypothetical protein
LVGVRVRDGIRVRRVRTRVGAMIMARFRVSVYGQVKGWD